MPFISPSEAKCAYPDYFPPEIIRRWNHLALSSSQVDPACCAANWNLAFHDVFHPSRRLFHLSSGNALLLFCENRSADNDIYLTPVEDSWMFGQPLLGFYAPELLEEALDIFDREYAPHTPAIVLSGIRKRSPETLKLFVLHSKKYNFYAYNSCTQCSASLQGGLDGWLGRRSANHRAKLKKAARKALEHGVSFERARPSSPVAASAIYLRMLAVERASWKGLEHCGMAESPSREFYGALLERLSLSRAAYVIFARHEGRDAGFIFGQTCGPVYRGQQFSYLASLAHLSLGNLLQLEKIRWLCEEGYLRYDMGPITGPRMEYKKHWTEQEGEIQTWVMRKA